MLSAGTWATIVDATPSERLSGTEQRTCPAVFARDRQRGLRVGLMTTPNKAGERTVTRSGVDNQPCWLRRRNAGTNRATHASRQRPARHNRGREGVSESCLEERGQRRNVHAGSRVLHLKKLDGQNQTAGRLSSIGAASAEEARVTDTSQRHMASRTDARARGERNRTGLSTTEIRSRSSFGSSVVGCCRQE